MLSYHRRARFRGELCSDGLSVKMLKAREAFNVGIFLVSDNQRLCFIPMHQGAFDYQHDSIVHGPIFWFPDIASDLLKRLKLSVAEMDTARDALDIEEPRKAQAQALIDTAETYKNREEAARKQRDELTGAAGKENAEAQGINKQISVEKGFDDKQAAADQYIAGLHQQSAAQIAGASGQTTRAVQHLTDTTLSGFGSIVSVLAEHDKRMDQLARQIVSLGRTQ